MRDVLRAIAICIASLSTSAFATTHCQPSEVVYFSCQIDGSEKFASVCGSASTNSDSPHWPKVVWLQYRYGKLGHPEMKYPARKAGSLKRFSGYWSISKIGGYAIDQLSFENMGFMYYITDIESADPTETEPFLGVEVLKGTKTVARLPCANAKTVERNLREAVVAVQENK